MAEIPLKFNAELMKTYPEEFLRARFKFLLDLFPTDYDKYSPLTIPDEVTLLYLLHVSLALESLKDCPGFNTHVAQYKDDVGSAYFVTTLASFLKKRTQALVLEPDSADIAKKGDILVTWRGREILIECKSPRKEVLSALRPEQEQMYVRLAPSIVKPCDVTITYESPLSDTEIDTIGVFLTERLPRVTGEGTILDRGSIKIEVTAVREHFVDIGETQIHLILENYHSKERNPVNIINRNGIAISFIRREVSVFDNVESQFRKSKNKSLPSVPLVLAIQSDYLTGGLDQNIRRIGTLFQPQKYTRFNGVILTRWSYNRERLITFESQYINNPYARNPVLQLYNLFTPSVQPD